MTDFKIGQWVVPTKGILTIYSVTKQRPIGRPYTFTFNPEQFEVSSRGNYESFNYPGGNLPVIISSGVSELRLRFTLKLVGDELLAPRELQPAFQIESGALDFTAFIQNTETIPTGTESQVSQYETSAAEDVNTDINTRDVGLVWKKLQSVQYCDNKDEYRLLFTFGTFFEDRGSLFTWYLENCTLIASEFDAAGTMIYGEIELELLADATKHSWRSDLIQDTLTRI